ncbi:MAG: AAA family ATPase, partial [Planctomycetes bacterium]|nr:AAA family ATPase [Planctomycetota bacterium]
MADEANSFITKITLERFKKFKSISLDLKPFTLIMGENSSGKTSVLQALNLALTSLKAF